MKKSLLCLVAVLAGLLSVPAAASAALSWSAGTISGTPNGPIVAVAWNESQNPNGQLFVAVTKPTSSLGTNDLLTSTDGQSWTVRSSGVAGAWNDIAFGGLNDNRVFWAVGDGDKVMYGNSTGTTWGEVTTATGTDSTRRDACASACGNWNTASVGDSGAMFLYSSNGFVLRSGNGNQRFEDFAQSSNVGTVNYSAAAYYQVPNATPIEYRLWSFGTGSTPANSTTAIVYSYTSPSAPAVSNQRGISAPFTGENGPVVAAAASYTLGNPGPSRTTGLVIVGGFGVYRSTGDPGSNWTASSLYGLTAANVRGVVESNNKWLVVDSTGNTWVATGIGGSWSTAPPISGATPEDVTGSWKLCRYVVVGGSAIHYSTDDSNTCSSGGSGGGSGGSSGSISNLVPPAVTQSGCTLTVSDGMWVTGSGNTYTYTWIRSNAAALAPPTETVGTAKTYTLTAADDGKYLRASVRATHPSAGIGSAGSNVVGPISGCGSASATPSSPTSTTSSGKPTPGPALKVTDIPAEITLDLGSSTSPDGTIPPDQPITAEVPCNAPEGQLLDRCTVNVTAPQYVLLGQGDGINVRADKKVSIGKATVKAKSGKKTIIVKVKINQRGRKALKRNLKIEATVGLTAITVSNQRSTGDAETTMRLPTQLISPAAGIFDSNSTTLNTAGVAFVNRLAALLPKAPKNMVFIGFTDITGVPGDNRWIADRRAQAVRDALEAKGIDPAKSSIEVKAATSPRDDNATEAGRERNRRVSIRITY